MLLFDVMENDSPLSGDTIEVPGGAIITYEGITLQRSAGTGDTITLIVQFAGQAITSLGLNLFSSWLYDKLTNRNDVKTVHIKDRELKFETEEEIKITLNEIMFKTHVVHSLKETIRDE